MQPYRESSALSRSHYSLVKSLESATSDYESNEIIYEELRRIYANLNKSDLTSSKVQHHVIMAMFCKSVQPSVPDPDDFIGTLEFIKPWIVKLTAKNHSLQQRSLAFVACRRLLKRGDEFSMMLLNTLYEDVHSHHPRTVINALDTIRDLVPLESLDMFHDVFKALLRRNQQPEVVLRVLITIREICTLLFNDQETTLYPEAEKKFLKQCLPVVMDIYDTSYIVPIIKASLSLMLSLVKIDYMKIPNLIDHISAKTSAKHHHVYGTKSYKDDPTFQVRVLQTYCQILNMKKLERHQLNTVTEYLTQILSGSDFTNRSSVILESVRLISRLPVEQVRLIPLKEILNHVRELLWRSDASSTWFILEILSSIQPELWTSTDNTSLGPREWKQILDFLHSNDSVIRIRAIEMLSKVNAPLASQHINQLRQQLSESRYLGKKRQVLLARTLEAIETVSTSGSQYCLEIQNLTNVRSIEEPLNTIEPMIVEAFLQFFEQQPQNFQLDVTNQFASILTKEEEMSCTLIVLMASVICEKASNDLSISALTLIESFVKLLPTVPDFIKEVIILIIIRLLAQVESIPSSVTTTFEDLLQKNSPHLELIQFTLGKEANPSSIRNIVNSAASNRLPDFTASLKEEIHKRPVKPRPEPNPNPSNSDSTIKTPRKQEDNPFVLGNVDSGPSSEIEKSTEFSVTGHRDHDHDDLDTDDSSRISDYFPKGHSDLPEQSKANESNLSSDNTKSDNE